MRMRRKAWTEPLLDECSFMIECPSENKGRWRERFERKDSPLWLEIGCGKGVATVQLSAQNRNVNLIAVDEVRTVLAVAIKNAVSAYAPEMPDNLLLSAVDAMFITDSFSDEDGIERIIINFPNPWDERAKHHKRRLTHPRQLMQYRTFLKPGGEIWFKTDNTDLFTASKRYFPNAGFEIVYLTDDLHASGFQPNYISEHELLYSSQGKPIHFLIAEMRELPEDHVFRTEGRNYEITERGTKGGSRSWEITE